MDLWWIEIIITQNSKVVFLIQRNLYIYMCIYIIKIILNKHIFVSWFNFTACLVVYMCFLEYGFNIFINLKRVYDVTFILEQTLFDQGFKGDDKPLQDSDLQLWVTRPDL